MKAKTNGIETNYELHGSEGAPWLVLSHSLACSVRMWDPQIEALKGSYRILAYDTRGHGASEAPPGPYTLEMLADDLMALLDALGVKNPHYCGLSMGGMIGQTFALKYPGVFRTLMLADTTSRYPAEAGPLWEQRIAIAREKGMQPLVQPTLERWFTEGFRQSNPRPVAAIAKLIASTPVAGYAGCCQAIPKINVTDPRHLRRQGPGHAPRHVGGDPPQRAGLEARHDPERGAPVEPGEPGGVHAGDAGVHGGALTWTRMPSSGRWPTGACRRRARRRRSA